MDESIVLNDVSLFYLEASEYINENIIDLGDDHQLFLEEEKKGFWAKVWDGIKKFFQTIWNWIKNFFTWLFGGKLGDPGKIEKILDKFGQVVRKLCDEIQEILNNKDEEKINNIYKRIIMTNLCPTFNYDLEDSQLIQKFKVSTVTGTKILNSLKSDAKKFIDKKMPLASKDDFVKNIDNKSLKDKCVYLEGYLELQKNVLSFYNSNGAIRVYLLAMNNIACNLINTHSSLCQLLAFIMLGLDSIKEKTKTTIFDELNELVADKSALVSAFAYDIIESEIIVILRFYAGFGFIDEKKYTEIYMKHLEKRPEKQTHEIINHFRQLHSIKDISKSENSITQYEPLIKNNQGDQYDEYEEVRKRVKALSKKGVDYSKFISDLEKEAKAQTEVPQEKIISVLQKITSFNKFIINLFNNTKAYLDLNEKLIKSYETAISKANL